MNRLKTFRNKVTDFLGYWFLYIGCWFYRIRIEEYFTYDELKELFAERGDFGVLENRETLPVIISRMQDKPVQVNKERLKKIFRNIKTKHHGFGTHTQSR
jgi:hypothetical protein